MKFIFGEGFQRTLGGSMMVAGTAIGAGMLALPMTSAGMWFNWSMVLMLLSWFCMLRASQAILEVNLLFEPGDSLHTLVQNTLGSFWSVLNGFPWPSCSTRWSMPTSAAAAPWSSMPCSPAGASRRPVSSPA